MSKVLRRVKQKSHAENRVHIHPYIVILASSFCFIQLCVNMSLQSCVTYYFEFCGLMLLNFRKMHRSRIAATAQEWDVPNEVSAQDKAHASRRWDRRPSPTQVEEQPPPVQEQSFVAQGPIDPMAATLARLQRTIDMMAQYMVHLPQQQQPTTPRGEPYK